jgi:hypothetical protein
MREYIKDQEKEDERFDQLGCGDGAPPIGGP